MTVAENTSTDYDRMSQQLKVLADPRRLRIFNLLMDGVQCNCELGDNLEMAPNLISHHLGVLRRTGLVNAERDPVDSRWVYYSVDEEAVRELAGVFGAFFDPSRIKPRRPDCGPSAARST